MIDGYKNLFVRVFGNQRCIVRIVSFFLTSVFLLVSSWAIAENIDRSAQISQYQQDITDLEQSLANYQERLDNHQRELLHVGQVLEDQSSEAEKLRREISFSEQQLEGITNQVTDLRQRIATQESLIQSQRNRLRDLFRALQEYESQSVVEMMLREHSLSDALSVIDRLRVVQQSVDQSLRELRTTQSDLSLSYDQLRVRERELSVQKEISISQQLLLEQEMYQQEVTKTHLESKVSEYRDAIADALSAREEIEQNIYRLQLQGVSQDFALGDIVALARQVGDLTGVRPAFLMAVLKQESNLGANTGTAYYVDAYTCNGQRDLSNSYVQRQITEFQRIAIAVGRDPEQTNVSACPGYGSGGAMGPAQFMPLTWIGYEADVARLRGREMADPWDLTDAMIAMGLKLAKAGAGAQTVDAERNAALVYYSGGVNHQYDWYADSILKIAEEYNQEF